MSDTADPRATSSDPRWARIVARDAGADGLFWYGVATTGVYCRPSCPSRTANPVNVVIHATLVAARAAGGRPCRRCDPEGDGRRARNAAIVEQACRTIAAADDLPGLAALAAAAGLGPDHFHRLFKTATGVTPRGYAVALRAGRVRRGLLTSPTVTAAIYEAGYGSNGRFYADATGMLGMTPSAYRRGGAGERLRYAYGDCALGLVLVAASERGVAAILLGDDPDMLLQDLRDRFPRATLVGRDADHDAAVARVVAFVDAPATGLDLPLDIGGTAFQQRVWQALRAVPAGATASYADIARRIGAPAATRAVAGACAANPLAVAIPCHRVVRSDGGLSGYRWGTDRKRRLLEIEAG